LRGILARMPLVGISFGTAAFAVAGVPPMNLFFSKFTIFAGGFQVSQTHLVLLALVLVAILESIGSFAWFLKRFGNSVPGQPSETIVGAGPLPISMAAALVVLVGLTLCSGIMAAAWLK
jgi:hydrogenase-4 component D